MREPARVKAEQGHTKKEPQEIVEPAEKLQLPA